MNKYGTNWAAKKIIDTGVTTNAFEGDVGIEL